jgi:hypothetical protein
MVLLHENVLLQLLEYKFIRTDIRKKKLKTQLKNYNLIYIELTYTVKDSLFRYTTICSRYHDNEFLSST